MQGSLWSDHAENTGPSPLGLAPHELTSSYTTFAMAPINSPRFHGVRYTPIMSAQHRRLCTPRIKFPLSPL